MFKYLLIVITLIIGTYYYLDRTEPYEYGECDPFCNVTVQRVIDGDTFTTESGLVIRLAGVDTPEINSPLGYQHKLCLEALIGNKNIRIKLLQKDKYGRQVAQVISHRSTCNRQELRLFS
jgi:endonuclease YncB( thermonuclease family)